ncbi:MAG: hypothetical protein J4428_01205 [Candidatus Aenigmarchaeota archaeon]|nr:hypothetical protein [Candidatus Aenigmarchaeota archaeon]
MKRLEDETTIVITKDMTADKIYYKILRAYFNGYKKIILVGSITDVQMDFLVMMHKRIVGLEVTEQKKDQIIITDLLKPEDVDLDKIVNQMFSFITIMTNDIILHISEDSYIGDKVLNRDSIIIRNHNLAYRCCNMALKDSIYLGKLKKTTNQVLVISRIIRSLDMIGTILIGISYLLNTETTRGMKKFHYKTFEKNDRLNKILDEYLRKWSKNFKSIKSAIKERDIERIIDLYVRRFETKLNIEDKNLQPSEHLTNIVDLADQLSRMSALILRDFMMY